MTSARTGRGVRSNDDIKDSRSEGTLLERGGALSKRGSEGVSRVVTASGPRVGRLVVRNNHRVERDLSYPRCPSSRPRAAPPLLPEGE